MNNLKFRVWDKKLKLLGTVSYIDFDSKKIIYRNNFVGYYVKFEDVEIMQSTGFKDKNGVEIFIGDIVNCGYLFTGSPFEEEDDYTEDIGVIKIVNCGAVVKINGDFECLVDVLNNCEDFEIIGNIYENKELLENE